MFEMIMLALFGWLFISAVVLLFKVSWGIAKVIAIILLLISCPIMIELIMLAGGVALLSPVLLIGLALVLLKGSE